MFHTSESGSTHQPTPNSEPALTSASPVALPAHNQEVLCLFLLGDHAAVRNMISRLAISGIADATRWTPLQPTGREDEYIAVHTKRIAPEKH